MIFRLNLFLGVLLLLNQSIAQNIRDVDSTDVEISHVIRFYKDLEHENYNYKISFKDKMTPSDGIIEIINNTESYLTFKITYKLSDLGIVEMICPEGKILTIIVDQRNFYQKKGKGKVHFEVVGNKIREKEYFYIFVDKVYKKKKTKSIKRSKIINQKVYNKVINKGYYPKFYFHFFEFFKWDGGKYAWWKESP